MGFSHSLEQSKERALIPPRWTLLDSLNVALVYDQWCITQKVFWITGSETSLPLCSLFCLFSFVL